MAVFFNQEEEKESTDEEVEEKEEEAVDWGLDKVSGGNKIKDSSGKLKWPTKKNKNNRNQKSRLATLRLWRDFWFKNMEKEHLKAIRINQEIGNYNKVYCKVCGKEIDIYDDEQGRQNYLENALICEECQDNN